MGELERRIRRLEGDADDLSAGQYGAWGESAEEINRRFREWVESDPLATQEELDIALEEVRRVYGVTQ